MPEALPHPIGHQRRALLKICRRKVVRHAGDEVQLYALGRVVFGQLLKDGELVVADLLMDEAASARTDLEGCVHIAVGGQPYARDKVHSLIVRPVY